MHTCLITLTLDNQKRFWSLVKRLRKNFDEPVATLYADYNLKTTPVSKTEALNQQFYSVFTRPGLSCQTQPVLLVDKILKAMDSHHQVARSAATQFLQASNTVAHNKLLLKLAHYDIQSNTHQWIATWLTTRTQNVIVEGERSKDKRVLSGVPQRTVLGPLMILLYINVIDRDICSLIRLFTDDYIPVLNYRNTQRPSTPAMWPKLPNTLNQAMANEAKPRKMCNIEVHPTPHTISGYIFIINQPLQAINQYTNLGVKLHSSWHGSIISRNKATKILNFVKRTLYQCDTKVKATT